MSPSKISETCVYIYNRALINAHCFTNSPPTSHQTRARPLINRPIGQDGERARSPPRCNAFLSSTAAQLILSLRRGRANCVCLPGPARFRGPKHPDTVKVEIQGAKSERKEKNWKWVSERASEWAKEREREREVELGHGQSRPYLELSFDPLRSACITIKDSREKQREGEREGGGCV